MSRRWELLGDLSLQQQEDVLRTMVPRRYRAREVLFHADDEGESLHLIERGRVAVRTDSPSGETATLAILGPGQALGEMALLRRSRRRTASAVALEPVATRTLARAAFFRLCDREPSIERLMVNVLAARVDRLSRHMVEALHTPVEVRVARRLLEVARLYADEAGGPVVLPLTQQDIAGLAGTTRPTASTILNGLQEAGAVVLARGRLELVDVERLRERAR